MGRLAVPCHAADVSQVLCGLIEQKCSACREGNQCPTKWQSYGEHKVTDNKNEETAKAQKLPQPKMGKCLCPVPTKLCQKHIPERVSTLDAINASCCQSIGVACCGDHNALLCAIRNHMVSQKLQHKGGAHEADAQLYWRCPRSSPFGNASVA